MAKLRYSSGCQGGHEWLYGVGQRPTLHITATADNIQIPGYSSGVADRLALYQATGASTQAAKVLAVFKDGSHSISTEGMGTGGATLNPKVKVATRQLALVFLNCGEN